MVIISASRGVALAHADRLTGLREGSRPGIFGLSQQSISPSRVELKTVQERDYRAEWGVSHARDRLPLQVIESGCDMNLNLGTQLARSEAQIGILEVTTHVNRI